ncbi:TPA: hypothetical protein R2318_000200 [Legionella pneumophila]|nr:hypothetical protein [Legionella pneumophila]HAT8333752.1 hypothetical protein [Legionella pneumophila]HAU2316444.1 hypothetical protein [Legionella pneumophila]HCJ1049160.1 hypothetical protein [Legionella pneumophila]HEC4725081.1 hypothetical protein [Legionella pneumophila]
MRKFEWQSNFPSHCPGMNAQQNFVDGALRLVKDSNLQEDYFYPYYNYNPDPMNKCQCWAITFLNDIRDAEYIRAAVPGYRNYKIAKGDLEYSFGELIIDGVNIFLWRYENVVIHPNFRVI